MQRKAFTLVEIIAVVVVMGVLATLALPYFLNMLESSKDDVCITNIETLKKAVDMYVIEQQVVPASLAALPQKYIDRAYAQVWQKASWRLRLAKSIVERREQGVAYALTRFPHLRCPKNLDPSPVSYGLNREVAGKSAAEYKALAADTIVVGDSDAYVADFCKSKTTVLFKGKSGKIKSILNEIECPEMSDLIESRGHVKYGMLGKKNKFLIATTGDGVLVTLIKGKGKS